jgi:hypothetical protein
MFFARFARLDSVGQPERGKMSHEAECHAMAVHPVVACASNVYQARQSATSSHSQPYSEDDEHSDWDDHDLGLRRSCSMWALRSSYSAVVISPAA